MPKRETTARDEIWIPAWLLRLARALTIITLAWTGWLLFDLERDGQFNKDQTRQLEHLRGDILHADEVLSASVRLAATTKDAEWEARYRRFEPALSAAINDLKALAVTHSSATAAAPLGEAHGVLVEMENRAFVLVRAGRIDEARDLVFSDEYRAERRRYARAWEAAFIEIGLQIQERERRHRRFDFLSLLGAITVIATSLLVWASVTRHSKRSRGKAAHALWKAHNELETRIAQRTKELERANFSLQEEIAERTQIQEAFRASNEQFHQLADNIHDVFWIRSPDGHELRYISPAFEQIWGRSRESLRANPQEWIDFVLPEDRDRVQSRFEELQRDVRNVDLEYRVERPSGEIRWVHLRASQVRDDADDVISLIGIVTDITDRKSAEATRDRMVEILESTTDMVSFADPGGNLLYMNAAGYRLFGVNPDDDITKIHLSRFVPDPANHRGLTVGLPTAMREGTWSGEVTLQSLDGRQVSVSQVIICHKLPDDKLDYIATIIRDLTEVKRLGAQLVQSQKLETVGRLAGGIAHEFNSILTAIIGRSEFLLADLPVQSPLVQHATEIRTAVGRAASLTERLLAYGRKQTLFPVRLDLNRTTLSMGSMLRHLLGSQIDLRFVLPAGVHAVKADAGQIEQVIVNLVINARDALPDGGKVTVETANVTLGEASAGFNPDLEPGDYVVLAITDTGMGMSEDVKKHIFEPFFTTKDVGLGTGLGLSTCDGIVKQSGGAISVYSEPNVGTAFKVYLPRDDRPAGDRPAPQQSPSLPRGSEKILLVEDDRALREMAAELLRRLGYVVLDADSGANALKLIEDSGDAFIDLLFTDVVMPEISGTQLADRVRALRPKTKTLFTSAYTENAVVHQRMLNSDSALLEKPFTPSALANKVREVLDRRAA